MSVLTPEQVASVDPCYWALAYKIQLVGGLFTLHNHEYLEESLRSIHRIEVVMKGTQGGFTETEVLRALHGLINRRYPKGILYLFPTRVLVQEFSKTRFDPLIAANRDAIGKFVKTGGKGTDTSEVKKIGNAFLYFKGATLTQQIGYSGVKESSKLSSTPVDAVKYDEFDYFHEDVRGKAQGRMGHSEIREERFLSNPIVPGMGIDALFQASDQRYWHRKCGSCNEWTCAEKEFPDCVKFNKATGRGYIACKKCGKPLSIGPGEWVADYKDRPIVGRRWSQLTSSFNDPYEILQQINDPDNDNLSDTYRKRLGLPHVAAEDRLTEQQVFDCCGHDIMQSASEGPCAMGVDIGKTKHVIIGRRIGKDRYDLLRIERIPQNINFPSRLHYLAKMFNVRSAVIDIEPYTDEVRAFQSEESYRVYLCKYSDNMIQAVVYNDKEKTIRVNKTEVYDATHRIIAKKQIVFPRAELPEMKEFAKQICNPAKVLELQGNSKVEIFRYRGKNDHYRSALTYFYLAAQGGRISTAGSARDRQKYADNDYARI